MIRFLKVWKSSIILCLQIPVNVSRLCRDYKREPEHFAWSRKIQFWKYLYAYMRILYCMVPNAIVCKNNSKNWWRKVIILYNSYFYVFTVQFASYQFFMLLLEKERVKCSTIFLYTIFLNAYFVSQQSKVSVDEKRKTCFDMLYCLWVVNL